MKSSLTAKKTSWILIGFIVFFIAAGAAGIWFLQQQLVDRVEKANEAIAAAASSTGSLDNAKALQVYLQKHSAEIGAAEKIVADSKFYKYQNQIVGDLNNFAKQAGVSVTGFTFSQTLETVKPDSNGLSALPANVNLASKTSYSSYRAFLKLIEQNSTRMQITDVSLTPSQDNPAVLENPSLVVEVYINKQ